VRYDRSRIIWQCAVRTDVRYDRSRIIWQCVVHTCAVRQVTDNMAVLLYTSRSAVRQVTGNLAIWLHTHTHAYSNMWLTHLRSYSEFYRNKFTVKLNAVVCTRTHYIFRSLNVIYGTSRMSPRTCCTIYANSLFTRISCNKCQCVTHLTRIVQEVSVETVEAYLYWSFARIWMKFICCSLYKEQPTFWKYAGDRHFGPWRWLFRRTLS
jgi:hypothetical protein